MFCTKCGSNISDDSDFCVNCGSPTKRQIKPTVKPKKKNNSGLVILIMIGIIILFLVGVIIKLLKNSDDSNGDNSFKNPISKTLNSNSKDANETLDFNAIVSQCPGCEESLNLLVELCDLGTQWEYDEDGLRTVNAQKCSSMQHHCSADVIYVKNLPYVYREHYGAYTGEWQGAGPTGYGTFVGKEPFADFILSYTGDWAYGLPNGQGELYIENYQDVGNTMTYYGNMVDGIRSGQGYMQEYIPNRGFMVYGDTYFQNDTLAQETLVTMYDKDTGDILEYYTMVGDGYGSTAYIEHWYYGEPSPAQIRSAEVLAGTLFTAFIVYQYKDYKDNVTNYKNKLNSEVLADAKRNEEQRQAEYQKRLDEARESEKTRKWNEDKYYEAINSDPNEYNLDTKNYKYQAGFGW